LQSFLKKGEKTKMKIMKTADAALFSAFVSIINYINDMVKEFNSFKSLNRI